MAAQASTSASAPAPTPAPLVVNAEYYKEIERARRYLRALISSKNCAPMMLRTYDALTKTGGPNGSIRNPQELNHSANRGLETAVDLCEKVKRKHPCITYADLYQLAGVVAVEVTGGPTIHFVPGRQDSLSSPKEGLLPDANKGADHLRSVFNRMGLEDKDIAALSGAHTLGGAHKQVSGFDGKWTEEPWKFDNSYFKELLKSSTKFPTPSNPPTGYSQQKPSSSATGEDSTGRRLFIFSTDQALIKDPKFLEYVMLYEQDEEAFFRDYAASHKKLSELGFVPPTWTSRVITAVKNSSTMAKAAAGVAFATTAIAITFYYRQRSQREEE
ncbi:putative L-ascorbate peroxidase 3, peroxisomal [Vitis vinifera]|uniref:L-ascorbate peroxidase n=1 Tax=Vitis vinifera TaxID=29760 RepID=A0A438K6C5_VITVI|nr:putative L-ascorbate peroxidase 3, peroxisomal [Vitis vinifera]